MKRTNPTVAIEIGQHAVRAVSLRSGRVVWAERDPNGADGADALCEVVGEVGGQGARGVLGVSRLDAVLKTIAYPEAALPEHERPSFVRLQMERQLPFAPEHAVVDFVAAPHDPPSCLAAAIRSDIRDRALSMARVGGCKDPIVGLIDEGIARAMGGSASAEGAAIGVVAMDDRCEIVIARGGRLLMSRSCDVHEAGESWATLVATEARRTAMSYRVRQDSVPLEACALMCNPDAFEVLSDELASSLGLESVRPMPSSVPEGCPVACARLLGLLALGDDHLDFASPTAPPDRNARKRQMAMFAALVFIVLIGAWFTMGLREQRALSGELEQAKAEQGEARAKAIRVLRNAGRLHHAQAWLDAGVDWNAHVDLLSAELPSADAMLLDRFSLSADTSWDYNNRGSRTYDTDRWLTESRVSIGVAARAKNDDVVRAIRESLIALDAYTLTPVGEDAGAKGEGVYPVGTAFTLSSRVSRPLLDTDGGDTDG